MNQKTIVAFVGRAGSGKDYQCNLLKQQGYKQFGFADTLRHVTARILNISDDEFLSIYDSFKQDEVISYKNENMEQLSITGRQILEHVGASIREIDEYFWINALLKRIENAFCDKICISDLRYYNEFVKLNQFCEFKNYDFKVVFCDYHSHRYQESNEHESAAMSNYFAENGYIDLQILNNQDFEKFNAFVKSGTPFSDNRTTPIPTVL